MVPVGMANQGLDLFSRWGQPTIGCPDQVTQNPSNIEQ